MSQILQKELFNVIDETTTKTYHHENVQKFTSQALTTMSSMIKLEQMSIETQSAISKQKLKKRERKLSASSKWTDQDYVKYYKFCVKYHNWRPFMHISWNSWKGDLFFKHMSKYIGKTTEQCKSKDENMKTKFSQKYDVLDLSILKLKQVKDIDNEAYQLLRQFQQKSELQSPHMRLLNQRITQINDQQNQIFKMNFWFNDTIIIQSQKQVNYLI